MAEPWLKRVDHAPVAGGFHTAYFLVLARPGVATPFPMHNFRLTTRAHQAEAAEEMKALGLTLELPADD